MKNACMQWHLHPHFITVTARCRADGAQELYKASSSRALDLSSVAENLNVCVYLPIARHPVAIMPIGLQTLRANMFRQNECPTSC